MLCGVLRLRESAVISVACINQCGLIRAFMHSCDCSFQQTEQDAEAVDVMLALAVHRRGASGVYATVLSHSTTHKPTTHPLIVLAVHTAKLLVSRARAGMSRL